MDSIYIETSIVSHATAWPSSDPANALLQQQARDWWEIERSKFRVVTSQLVIDEAAVGDPKAAADRLALLDGIDLIPVDPRIEGIADELIARSLMPANARLDALHVAIAAVGGVQFLLTQNCRHIANGHTLPRVYKTLEELGFPNLLIYTPAVFLGETDDDT
jgi:predicted nucleic acid-binding protein